MAEGLVTHDLGDRVQAFSGGLMPCRVHSKAIRVMKEIGIDISHHRSKHLAEFMSRRFDYVITVCDRAKESCPVYPWAGSLLHWSFDDPAAATGTEEKRKAVFRRVRDEIAARVSRLAGS
ncbi:MAG: arsenate reductase ArsC, partial [Nitrospiria bacterium]